MNKKKLIILISIIIALAVLVCVGIFALSGKGGTSVADKLDLGEKYLAELEYEKALAVYKEILEIDPKSVEAYLGMAEVYIAMGEYEEALKILEEGYEETESRKLETRIEEVEALMTRGENAENNAETGPTSGSQGNNAGSGDDNLDPRFEACVVDGILRNGYSLYDLTEEEEKLLASLIQFAQQKNWDEIYARMYGGQLSALIENYGVVQEFDGVKNGSIRIAFEEYKVYLEMSFIGQELVIIPLNDGTGYYFAGYEDSDYCRIVTSDCRNGMFDGEFAYKEISYIPETREVVYTVDMSGTMVNGLLDGMLYERTEYQPDDVSYFVIEYEAGILKTVKEEVVDGMLKIYYGYATDENWTPLADYSGARYSICSEKITREELDKHKYIMPHAARLGVEVAGGIMYYSW